MKRESGTCNFCSAPCSSCLHIPRGLMGSKGNEFSDETCQGNGGSPCSTSSDVLSIKSSTICNGQHAPCESSNLLSVNSNHDSFSENSKENMRCSGPYSLSEGVKVEPNLFKAVMPDQLFMKHQCDHNQGLFQGKIHKGNASEDHEDSISCFSAANTSNKLVSIGKKDTGKVSGSAASSGSSVPEKSKAHVQTSKDCHSDARENHKTSGGLSRYTEQFHGLPSMNSPSASASLQMCSGHTPEGMKLDGGLSVSVGICSQHHNGNVSSIDLNVQEFQVPLDSSAPDCGRVELRTHVQKDAISDSSCKRMPPSNAHGGTKKNDVPECNSELLLSLKEEADNTSVGFTTESLNSSEKNVEKLKSESPAIQESSVQSQHQGESDEYEILEHDVKVCDICGDAGREDLLAICSVCSDGAEHTYCMREKMEKVPEGNWLCEECQLDDVNKDQKQVKEVMQSDIPKCKLDRQASVLLNRIDSTSGTSKRKKDIVDTKITGKRPAENVEVTSAMKKQTLEHPSTGLPVVSSLSRTSTLSRDSSFRNFEKGKLKPAQPNSDATQPTCLSDFPNRQISRGSLLKSNTFNFANKSGSELVAEVVLQKHKLSKEPVSLDKKEGPVRKMGKSMSFKHVHSGRKNPPESKVKMLSTKFPPTQDTKGLKQVKEHSVLERKSSFRSEGQINSTTGNLALPILKGEVKGTQCLTGVAGGSSVSEIATSAELKPNQSLPVENVFPNVSHIPEKSFEGMPIVLARPGDSADLGERREKSLNYKKPGMTIGGKNIPCQKCKGIGHAAEFCTIDNHQPLDNCSVKCPKEKINEDNKLKAAIEAAILKKPGIYRKNRCPDQSNGLTPNLNSDVTCKGQASSPSITRMISSDGNLDVSQSLPANVEVSTSALSNLVLVAASVPFKVSTIPQHDFAWIGGLEIHRSGKFSEIRDGIQAHISTCASPKVLDMTKKLPKKIVVNEVPRLSTWPMQFQEAGATEDNIALYFFAKDVESYEKSYKGLLETMIKKDLALKSTIDGVELLIFPSNRLPQESQRWNMMFFLWGVFKGKRINSLEKKRGFPIDLGNQGATDTMTSPDNLKSSEPIDKDLPISVSYSPEKSPPKIQASIPLSRVIGSTSTAMEGQHAEPKEPGRAFIPPSRSHSGYNKSEKMIPLIVVDVESNKNIEEDTFKRRREQQQPINEEYLNNNWQINHKNYHQLHQTASSSSSSLATEVVKVDVIPEMHFFPVNPEPVKDFARSSSSQFKVEDSFPDLELALGGTTEVKPTNTVKHHHGLLPFLSSKFDQTRLEMERAAAEQEKREEDASATLSLSLSFKFPDDMKVTKPRQNFKSSSLPPHNK